MKVLEKNKEVTYILELTEREIGTIKIALGLTNHYFIQSYLEENQMNTKVVKTDEQQSELYKQFVYITRDEY